MSRSKKKYLQGVLVGSSILAMSSVMVGCGDDKESNPEAVSVQDLKFPGALSVKDNGNGEVVLTWSGSNNEKDFDGYNVYGMKDKDGTLKAKAGQAIKLLDDKGEPVTAAKDYLALYNYDPEKGLEEAGVAAASLQDGSATSEASSDKAKSETPKFSALPIHTKSGDTRLLPTCQSTDNASCGTTTAGKSGTEVAVNGTISYKVPAKLTVGSTYCFLVLSSMDGGKKVSQTSSNVACVVPSYLTAGSVKMPSGTNFQVQLKAYLDSCIAGTCDLTKLTTETGNTTSATTASEGDAFIEYNQDLLNFVAGKDNGVIDLGAYANGLDDKTLPAVAPNLVLGTDTYSPNNVDTPIVNNGYSIAGQSVVMSKNHVYVLTSKGSAAGKYFYHWLHVASEPKVNEALEIRIRSDKNER